MKSYKVIVSWLAAVLLAVFFGGCTIQVVEPEPPSDKDYLVGSWKTAITEFDDEYTATEYEFGEDDELTITTLWYAWDPFCAEWVVTDEVVSTGPHDYYYLENGYVKMHLERLHMEYWVKYEIDEDRDRMILYLDTFVGVGTSSCLKGAWDMNLLSAQNAAGQDVYSQTSYQFDGAELTVTKAKTAGTTSSAANQTTTRYTDYGTCWRYFDGSPAKAGTFDPATDVFHYQIKDGKLYAYQKKQAVQLDKQVTK